MLYQVIAPYDLRIMAAMRRGPRCRVCGCSEFDPCPEGCGWVEEDLCSSCVSSASPETHQTAEEAPA